jgi:NAD+ synthase
MMTLYHVSNNVNGIVVGTGNKVEDFGVGFFTKYGDGGVDISPIADLYKSEVFKLGKELDIIPEIQNAKPTDGLWDDDRDDETQIGATYDELEWVMENYNETQQNLSKREIEVLEIYNKFNNNNKHKMVNIPIFKKTK